MNVMIIDTETANDVSCPLPYDVGYQIVDTETGEVLTEKSFVVAEIFFDKELMAQAYFADKIPQYFKEIKEGKRKVTGIFNVRRLVVDDMKRFDVHRVGAYNMNFDKRATNNDVRYISGSFWRWFFPYGTEFFCIWNMACTSILDTKEFADFAVKNGFVSEVGNIRTSAEIAYRYLTDTTDFEEAHTGLEDVKIEREILFAVLRSGMEYKDKPYSACWRKVQHWLTEG